MIVGPEMFDMSARSSLDASQDWIASVLLGEIAAGLCVVAVAIVGMVMLSGRLPVRQGAMVVLGCFVLLGAPAIAWGLMSLAAHVPTDMQAAEVAGEEVLYERPPLPPAVNDTYGRASLRRE
jgi:type IV secretion system protein VirB2